MIQEYRERYGKMLRERCPGGPLHKGPLVFRAYCGECVVAAWAGAWRDGNEVGASQAGGGAPGAPAGVQKPGETRTVTFEGKTVAVGYRIVQDEPRKKEPVGPRIADAMKGEE